MLKNFKIHTHKEFSALKAERDSLLQQIQSLKGASDSSVTTDKIVELGSTHKAELDALNAQHQESLNQLKADYENQISALQQQVQNEKQSSDVKAIRILASAGVPLEELPRVKHEHADSQRHPNITIKTL